MQRLPCAVLFHLATPDDHCSLHSDSITLAEHRGHLPSLPDRVDLRRPTQNDLHPGYHQTDVESRDLHTRNPDLRVLGIVPLRQALQSLHPLLYPASHLVH